jgi:hypothetical protein
MPSKTTKIQNIGEMLPRIWYRTDCFLPFLSSRLLTIGDYQQHIDYQHDTAAGFRRMQVISGTNMQEHRQPKPPRIPQLQKAVVNGSSQKGTPLTLFRTNPV